MTIAAAEGRIIIRPHSLPRVRRGAAHRPIQSDRRPRNVFPLDQGGDRLALFIAMLDGDAVALPANVERAASFDIAFGDQQ